MEPLIEIEEGMPECLSSREIKLILGDTRQFRGLFWANLLLCVVLGGFAIKQPGILPYFLFFSLISTAILLYHIFLLPRVRLMRYEKVIHASNYLMRQKVLRVYEDRLELSTQDGEEGMFLFSFPYQFLTQVGETTEYFFLFFSTEKWIPIKKKFCSITQQKQLRSLLNRYCRNYQQLNAVGVE